jgi:hypothetical protein
MDTQDYKKKIIELIESGIKHNWELAIVLNSQTKNLIQLYNLTKKKNIDYRINTSVYQSRKYLKKELGVNDVIFSSKYNTYIPEKFWPTNIINKKEFISWILKEKYKAIYSSVPDTNYYKKVPAYIRSMHIRITNKGMEEDGIFELSAHFKSHLKFMKKRKERYKKTWKKDKIINYD